jgi:hypothetical protein
MVKQQNNIVKTSLIIGIVGLTWYWLLASTGVSDKAVFIDNSYGYPIAFQVPDNGMVDHTDPLFGEIVKHWNFNPKEYASVLVESGLGMEEMMKIEKFFQKE